MPSLTQVMHARVLGTPSTITRHSKHTPIPQYRPRADAAAGPPDAPASPLGNQRGGDGLAEVGLERLAVDGDGHRGAAPGPGGKRRSAHAAPRLDVLGSASRICSSIRISPDLPQRIGVGDRKPRSADGTARLTDHRHDRLQLALVVAEVVRASRRAATASRRCGRSAPRALGRVAVSPFQWASQNCGSASSRIAPPPMKPSPPMLVQRSRNRRST